MNTHARSVSSFSLHLKLFVVAALCLLVLALVPAPARAAGLTGAQIDAVLQLLVAFDVPQDTIQNVDAILHGQSEGQVPDQPQVQSRATGAQVETKTYTQARSATPLASASKPSVAQLAPAAGPGAGGSSLVAAAAAVPLSLTANSLNIVADQVNEVNAALADVLSSYVALFSFPVVPQAAAAASAPAMMPASPIAGESLVATLAYMPQSLYETAGKTTDFLAAVEMAPVYVIVDGLSDALFKAGLY